MEKHDPKVSICIPTYNQAAFLELAVRSACYQDHPNIEVFVVNDASTDETSSILSRLKREFSCLKVIDRTTNVGLGRNVRFALMQGTGEYVVRLDSDDCLERSYVSRLLPLLSKHDQAGYAHCSVELIDERGVTIRTRYLSRRKVFESADTSLRALVWGYRVAANILMFRREALRTVGYSDESLNFAEDYDLVIRLADQGWGNVYCPQSLAKYRDWIDVGGGRSSRKLLELNGLDHVLNKTLPKAFVRRNWTSFPIHTGRLLAVLNHSQCFLSSTINEVDRNQLRIAMSHITNPFPLRLLLKNRMALRCILGSMHFVRSSAALRSGLARLAELKSASAPHFY